MEFGNLFSVEHITEMIKNRWPEMRVNKVIPYCFIFNEDTTWTGNDNFPKNLQLLVGYFSLGFQGSSPTGQTIQLITENMPQESDLQFGVDQTVLTDPKNPETIFTFATHVSLGTNCSGTFIGWLADLEPYVPGSPEPGYGFNFVLNLDGDPLEVSNELTDDSGNWVGHTDSSFQLIGGDTGYRFTVVLPKLGGVTADDDYSFSSDGDSDPIIDSAVDLGTDWRITVLADGAATGDEIITITSVITFDLVANNAADTIPGDDIVIDSIEVNGDPVIGGSYPVAPGDGTNSTFRNFELLADVVVTVSGITGTTVRVVDGESVFHDQPFTGAGDYTFIGIPLVEGENISVILL